MGGSCLPKQMGCFQSLETLAAVSKLSLENSISQVVGKPWKMLGPKRRELTQDRSPDTPGTASVMLNCLQKSSRGQTQDHKQKVTGLGMLFFSPSLISNIFSKMVQLPL